MQYATAVDPIAPSNPKRGIKYTLRSTLVIAIVPVPVKVNLTPFAPAELKSQAYTPYHATKIEVMANISINEIFMG